jgi:hypothetical protein
VFNFSTGLWEIDDAAASGANALDETVGTLLEYPGAATDATNALSDLGKGLDGATTATGELQAASDKLTLEEKLAIIAGQSQIATAQIEADAKRVAAAFESIGVTVTSTGTLIGELFGLLQDPPTLREAQKIERQIDEENRRRQEALNLQAQLTRAELRLIDEKANALRRGGSLIQIDGAGLQPHLEAFMWEILRTIQVRVNQEGLDLLVGA